MQLNLQFKLLLYSPAGGYLCYFEFGHLHTQTKPNIKQNIYLKDIVLVLFIGSAKIAKIKCL